MADSFSEDVVEDAPLEISADVEMDGAEEGEGANGRIELPFADGDPEDDTKPRVQFIDYLKSPVVTLLVGANGSETVLTAHQALLMRSPYFAGVCADFADDGSVRMSLSCSSTCAIIQSNLMPSGTIPLTSLWCAAPPR